MPSTIESRWREIRFPSIGYPTRSISGVQNSRRHAFSAFRGCEIHEYTLYRNHGQRLRSKPSVTGGLQQERRTTCWRFNDSRSIKYEPNSKIVPPTNAVHPKTKLLTPKTFNEGRNTKNPLTVHTADPRLNNYNISPIPRGMGIRKQPTRKYSNTQFAEK